MKALLIIIAYFAIALAQPPIPMQQDGIRIGNVTASSGIEVFYDLLCSGCAYIDPSFQEFLKMKTPTGQNITDALDIVYHFFPLPYHHNAFIVTQMQVFIFNTYGVEPALKYMNYMLLNQDWYLDALNYDQFQVRDRIVSDTNKLLGYPKEVLALVFRDKTANENTRVCWKLAAYRHITGTPTVLINGVETEEYPDTAEGWYQLLLPYF